MNSMPDANTLPCGEVLDKGPFGEPWHYECELPADHDGWHKYETSGIVVTWGR